MTGTAPGPPAAPAGMLPSSSEEREQARQRRQRRRIGAGLTAAISLLGVIAAVGWIQTRREQSELSRTQAEQTRLRAATARYTDVAVRSAEVERDEAALAAALGADVRWSRYLTDLSRVMPSGAWLLYLSAARDGAPAPPISSGTARSGAPGAGVDRLPLPAPPGPQPEPPQGSAAGVGEVRFTGRALGHPDVAAFLTAVAGMPGTATPYLLESSARKDEAGRDVVEFDAYAALTAELASGRYALAAR